MMNVVESKPPMAQQTNYFTLCEFEFHAATNTGNDESQHENQSAEPHEPMKEIELRTAPIDPRFSGTNAARYCYVAYNEYHRCVKDKGDSGEDECLYYARNYRSVCPMEWIERWNELRDAGTWFGKY
jgi:cytochrome c oxidase subunit 6b